MRYLYLFLLLIPGAVAVGQTLYTEEYRPQFHFTPQSGWIGDPDGLVKYQNKYHLFWWGHAESTDLVYWTEKIFPMRGDDGSFNYYTGSVVVDKNNTSGFGNVTTPPMVAIYTAHNKTSGIQDQRLSFSTDYELFQYYSGNPVLNINSTEFRDPDVFWYEATSKWIMAITLPLERKVDFYSSSDLKSWSYLSSFEGFGAQQQVWEVPQLIQLPVHDSDQQRWTLICSMGPNKMQYFVGDFNGTSFTLDEDEIQYLKNGVGLPGEVFEDFESGYDGWTIEGAAFGSTPSAGTLPDQTNVNGFLNNNLVNSYLGGDMSVGKLTSPSFTIEKNAINFLIAGGNNAATSIALMINGQSVRTATGDNSESLKWKGWDVSQYVGQNATLVITDNQTGAWGHVLIDHIMFSDVLMNTEREHARWIDYGADFYAGRAYRNYDEENADSVVWLGWMGNWEYANQVPTTWGRGAESIPRNIFLKETNDKYEIIQKPITALHKLRDDTVTLEPQVISGVKSLNELKRTRNTYEMTFSFEVDAQDHVGLNFFAGAAGRTTLGFDAITSTIYLDRRSSGNASFSANFPKLMTAPIVLQDNHITFHLFVDQSSVEVFVNQGSVVLTSLVFPYAESTGLELFSKRGSAQLLDLTFYPLKSIWGIEEPLITSTEHSKKNSVSAFPNPVMKGARVSVTGTDSFTVEQTSALSLFDVMGRQVKTEFVRFDNELSFNAPIAPGLYTINMMVRNQRHVVRLIVKE